MTATPDRAPDRTMRVVLIAIAVLLVVVAILLAATLLKKSGSQSPVATASVSVTGASAPSASPTATATITSAPASATHTSTTTSTTTTTRPPGPTFASFSAPSSAGCPDNSSVVTITIKWSSSNATKAWIGVGTKDAKSAPYATVPTSGSYDIGFPCSVSHQLYTVTLEDASGHLTSKSKDIQH
jgi:cell wall integrity and stress response component